ncbi:hypothetical protein KIPB_007698 [Kipferlia bialata]|uniref:Replication factor C C-terminal domain-containing protein n=1 Tax=Kipferlia bialata TaxID=797122 RepID=A0A9K3D258_9EUKA|nr:hypothetical protein KIPB_007698 [Kipferlia bialata]|eukprot:g7698.t1
MYSASTRFVLCCNTSTKIIEPIQSRCAIIRFKPLLAADMTRRLKYVLETEGVSYSPDGIDTLIRTGEGDMRNVLNNAQSTAAGFGVVNKDTVLKVCDVPHPELVSNALRDAQQGRLDEALAALIGLVDDGYYVDDVISAVYDCVLDSKTMPDPTRISILKEIANTQARVAGGCRTRLQVASLVSVIVVLSGGQAHA